MMMGENAGVQVRIWLPDEVYSVVRELAGAHTDGNVSHAIRTLLQRGLQKDALDSAAAEAMETVTSALDHLERLVFFTAQQAALTAVGQEQSARMATRQTAPNDPERTQLMESPNPESPQAECARAIRTHINEAGQRL